MKIQQVLDALERFAPLPLQEGWDNAGLQIGLTEAEVSGVLLCLDVTEQIVDEAINRGCNLVVSHHPLLFHGLKRISGQDYVQRTVMKAIKHDIAVISMHTNLDSALGGVNFKIAERLGATPLPPGGETAGHGTPAAGATPLLPGGETAGHGTPAAGATPLLPGGETAGHGTPAAGAPSVPSGFPAGEMSVPSGFPAGKIPWVLAALPAPMKAGAFVALVKERFGVACAHCNALLRRPVSTVAICGGAADFVLDEAIAAGADAFITGEMHYHVFFGHEQQIQICVIGHYESEQFTAEVLRDIIRRDCPGVKTFIAETNTNPIVYV